MTPLTPELARDAATHWLIQKYPEFTGPRIKWPDMSSIAGWQTGHVVPFVFSLHDFTTLEIFAPAFKAAVEHQEKCLRTDLAYSAFAETYEVAAIQMACQCEPDLLTNGFDGSSIVLVARMFARPREVVKT